MNYAYLYTTENDRPQNQYKAGYTSKLRPNLSSLRRGHTGDSWYVKHIEIPEGMKDNLIHNELMKENLTRMKNKSTNRNSEFFIFPYDDEEENIKLFERCVERAVRIYNRIFVDFNFITNNEEVDPGPTIGKAEILKLLKEFNQIEQNTEYSDLEGRRLQTIINVVDLGQLTVRLNKGRCYCGKTFNDIDVCEINRNLTYTATDVLLENRDG